MSSKEHSLKLILLTREVASMWTMQVVQAFDANWRWKGLISGCLIKSEKRKENLSCSELSVLLFYRTTNHFLLRLWHATKSELCPTTSSAVGPRSSKASNFPKPNLYQNKVRDNCLVVCCWSDPLQLLNSGRPLCLRFVLSKWMRCSTENCDACSQHWSTEKAQIYC